MCLQKEIPGILNTWSKYLPNYVWFRKVLYFVEEPRILEPADDEVGSKFPDPLFSVLVPTGCCDEAEYVSSI